LDLDLLAGRQLHPPLHALGRLRQRDGHRCRDVLPGGGFLLLEAEARAPPAPAGSAERLLQDVLEAAKSASAARAMHAVGAPSEGLEATRRIAALTEAAARPAEPLEALEARLAVGIDLAAIKGLALVRLAHDLVRGVELGEARGRLRIVLVGVR